MKSRFAVAILSLFLLLAKGHAQTTRDSLLSLAKEIRRMPLDTAQVLQLTALGDRIVELDKSLSFELLTEALQKSLKTGEATTIARCYRNLGLWQGRFGDYDKSLANYYESYHWATKVNDYYFMAGMLYNIGNIKYAKSEYDSCIYYYQQSQQIFEAPDFLEKTNIKQNKLDQQLSQLYENLSIVFSTLKNIKKADEYIDKAITITKKYTSLPAQENLASFMMQKAANYYENGDIHTSLQLRLQYLPVLENKHFKYELVDAYYNIAHEYLQLNKTDSAEIYANKQSALVADMGQDNLTAYAHLIQADIAFRKKNYSLAGQYITKAKMYFEKTEDILGQNEYFRLVKEIAFASGHYKEAYEYALKYDTTKDSLQSSKRAIEFMEREMRYETGKKESQISLQEAALKQKNLLNYILMGSALALLIIFGLSYRNYANRKKLQQQRIHELETEKQLLATQSLLKGQEDERSRLAKDLHDGLGGLLSGVKLQLGAMKGNLILSAENAMAFDRALNKLDESIGEMRRVAHNMMPEALLKLGLQQALSDYCENLSHNQHFSINCEMHGLDKRIDNTVEVVLYRIVQELLNNAVKHANASTILVQVIQQEDKTIAITVEDNGKGFDITHVNASQSAGIRNIESRVKYLNGIMDIKSAPGKGTSVYIECKIEKNADN